MLISDILNGQLAIEEKIPKFNVHVSEHVVSFRDNRLLMVIRLNGIPFESVDEATLKNRFTVLNRLLASVSKDKGSRLGIWGQLARRKMQFGVNYDFRSPFMQNFAAKYLEKFTKSDYFENRYYIALVLKYDDLEDGIAEMEDLGTFLSKSLNSYEPVQLHMYERNDILFSQVFSYLSYLVNGIDEEVPVTGAPAYELIESSNLHFGYDLLEIRSETETRYATMYDLKDFPDKSKPGMFDPALKAPMEFTLTQSFICMSTVDAQKKVDDQLNKMASVEDKAKHQMAELEESKGYLSSGELAFGDYHGALVVYGDTPKKANDNGATLSSLFLGQCGAKMLRASLSAPATYLSALPSYKVRPRPMPKGTVNLASAFSLHNYSTGKERGNPIGDGTAVIPLQTRSKSLFNFNFHYSKPGEDNRGEKIAGHSLILGATGTGKTTLQLTLLGFFERFDPKYFGLDKDRGMEPFFRALGGSYFPLKAGEPTGLNPFQLPDSPRNREFLYGLVTACGADENGLVSAEEEQQIKVAVDTAFTLPFEQRRFSRVLESIPNLGGNSLAERLRKWTHAGNGRYAWALDNETNWFDFEDLQRVGRLGFDVTDFLKEGFAPTEPVLSYLFHLKDFMQIEGGLLGTIIEEFWLPAKFKTTSAQMFDILKTGRKRGEFAVLVSQSPADAIRSSIFEAIRDQTPTKIYLPNPDAEYEDYKRCGLTPTEFRELKELTVDSRTFLIKQGSQSAFAMLDLYGFDEELAIISATTDNVVVLDEVIAEVGERYEDWMPLYMERRKGRKID